MADAYERAKAQRNWFEELTEKIPGWSGYADRERRRDADKAVREHVAKRLDAARAEVDIAKLMLTDRGELPSVGALDRLSLRLHAVADRIRLAAYGYAGLFDSAKIGDEQLASLYRYDGEMEGAGHALVQHALALVTAVRDKADPAQGLLAIETALSDLERRVDGRAQAMTA